jgi:hypothetical protein
VLIAAILGSFAYAPAIALVVSAEPDWAYAYWVPAKDLPGWLSPWLVVVAGVSIPVGFGLALRACRGRPAFVQTWFWVPFAAGVLPIVSAAPRLARQATFEQFHGDFGVRQLVGGPLGYLLLWLLVGLVGATWLARRSLHFLSLGGSEGS